MGGPLSCQSFLKGLPLQCSASTALGCGKSPAGSGMGNLIRNTGALDTAGGGRPVGGRSMLGNGGINGGGGRCRGNGRVWLWGPLIGSSDRGATGPAVFKT